MKGYIQRGVLWRGGAIFAATLGLAMPVLAAGDGSGTNNSGLLRGGYEESCVDNWLCEPPRPAERASTTMPAATPAKTATPAVIDCSLVADPKARAFYGCPPTAYQPPRPQLTSPRQYHGPAASKFEADWSVTLRGSYQRDSDGERFGIEVAPEVSLTRGTATTQVDIAADAQLEKEGGDNYRLSGAALDFDAAHLVNSDTGLGVGLRLEANQDSPYDPGSATGIAEQPLVMTGSGDLTLQRRFGRFGIQFGADAARQMYTVTRLTSGATTDNSYRNRTSAGGRVRALYEATGNIEVFVEGSAERDIYDEASPSLGVRLDSWTYAVQAGITGDWDEVVVMEVSAGYGLRRFDSSLLSDAPTALVAAELTYRPDETVEWSALFGTDISAPESSTGAAAQIDYTASLSGLYRINDRIALRGTVGGEWTRFSDTSETRTTYSAGAGADYTVNKQTTLSADYRYRVNEATGSPREDSHLVSLGLTYSR